MWEERGIKTIAMPVVLFFLIAILAMPTVLTSKSDNSAGSEIVEASCSLAGVWIPKNHTSAAGAVGEAVVGTGDYIFIAWCRDYSTTPGFWRYDPSTDLWNESMNVSGLPIGAFRNGAALAWDHGNYIYALLGARYSVEDDERCLFYRYGIINESWEQLADTPHAQGAGDALTWSGHDNQIYALLGSKGHSTAFACYNASNGSWCNLTFNHNWTCTDDGASLVWAGGEYLYALRGEYDETAPNGDFARYSIPNGTWEDRAVIPEGDCGVGDGASLLWTEKYPDYIYALGGGSCLEDPGYNFYLYSIASDNWEELESIPCPVGYYVGNRLGFANGHIYYWQGTPSTWSCGGNAFYISEYPSFSSFEDWIASKGGITSIDLNDLIDIVLAYHGKKDIGFMPTFDNFIDTVRYCRSNEKPSASHILINEIESNPAGNDNSNSVIEWVELYNPTSEDVDLSGWILKTTQGRIGKVYPSGTIEAKGYRVFGKGSQWLDNEGDSIILRDNGGANIDEVAFTDTDNDGRTWQRYPNGEDSWEFRWKTKGYSNGG